MASYMNSLSSSFTRIPSAASWFEVYAAFSTFMMLLRTAFNDLIPHQVQSFIITKLRAFFTKFHSANNQVSLKICQQWDGGTRNELFDAAQKYLPTRIIQSYKALKVGIPKNHKNLHFAVDQEVVDEFEGTKFTWTLEGSENNSTIPSQPTSSKNSFTLTFKEMHREKVMERYIPRVLRTYEAMRIVKIHTRTSMHHGWKESKLSHPATFDTLALNPELKKTIIDDLNRFQKRKELYKKVGKPWKRGYLLYGPPGTGKSSLIAAIANYLKFDVYNLEFTSIHSNSDLMRAMRGTSHRSIIVIEDIDCNKGVHTLSKSKSKPYLCPQDLDMDYYCDQEEGDQGKFTLSGLLNHMDGLWSGCGEERIIIFTTNHKDRIDPALLRPGRMDMHINLSFLKGKAFRTLAFNYLDIEGDHPLFEEIDELLEKTEVTPAVVAEHLIRNEDPQLALEALVQFLRETLLEKQVLQN